MVLFTSLSLYDLPVVNLNQPFVALALFGVVIYVTQ